MVSTKTDTAYSTPGKTTKKPAVAISKTLSSTDYWKMVGIVFILILYVTLVYGPIAAFLVELFPTKIRYTSMSLPYHIGNGVFGGLTPFIATLLTTIYVDNKIVGLMYPIIIAAVCLGNYLICTFNVIFKASLAAIKEKIVVFSFKISNLWLL